jgi:hypothetical protein
MPQDALTEHFGDAGVGVIAQTLVGTYVGLAGIGLPGAAAACDEHFCLELVCVLVANVAAIASAVAAHGQAFRDSLHEISDGVFSPLLG